MFRMSDSIVITVVVQNLLYLSKGNTISMSITIDGSTNYLREISNLSSSQKWKTFCYAISMATYGCHISAIVITIILATMNFA